MRMGINTGFCNVGNFGAAVFGSAEAVPFIRVVDIDHRDAVLLHRGYDLLGLRSFHAHVVRALADQ